MAATHPNIVLATAILASAKKYEESYDNIAAHEAIQSNPGEVIDVNQFYGYYVRRVNKLVIHYLSPFICFLHIPGMMHCIGLK